MFKFLYLVCVSPFYSLLQNEIHSRSSESSDTGIDLHGCKVAFSSQTPPYLAVVHASMPLSPDTLVVLLDSTLRLDSRHPHLSLHNL